VQNQRVGFTERRVSDEHFLLLARQAFRLALRTPVMSVISVDRSVQRAGISKNRTPHGGHLEAEIGF
jgi:hypothetical protein